MRPYLKSVGQLSLVIVFGMVLGYLICDDLWQATASQMIAQERAWSAASGGGAYVLDSKTGKIGFQYQVVPDAQASQKLAQGTPMYIALGDVVGWDGPTQQLSTEELRQRVQALQNSRYKFHSAKHDKLPQLPDMH